MNILSYIRWQTFSKVLKKERPAPQPSGRPRKHKKYAKQYSNPPKPEAGKIQVSRGKQFVNLINTEV
jgi:hypothetical protein